jgi:hypothetical protein
LRERPEESAASIAVTMDHREKFRRLGVDAHGKPAARDSESRTIKL